MTTGDAVCDVTHMIAQLMVAALVTKTKQDGEAVVTALRTALADSVTKTVSTYVYLSSLSSPTQIALSFSARTYRQRVSYYICTIVAIHIPTNNHTNHTLPLSSPAMSSSLPRISAADH
jgi:hypothetical protein